MASHYPWPTNMALQAHILDIAKVKGGPAYRSFMRKDTLDPMVRALEASLEAALEHATEEILLGVPYMPTTNAFKELLDAVENALSNAGLTSPRSAVARAEYNGAHIPVDAGGGVVTRAVLQEQHSESVEVYGMEASGQGGTYAGSNAASRGLAWNMRALAEHKE
ncbi:hypothetical protein CERZMDRAFT_92925 [Cercospora zeae-maydis SCOH1-5]|uniref:Uncharacterized protein n=1 Tax=Cercospora zeae-maydis SCOH1-5 TaxID=717836 RepID=A0A6A6FTN7_9PEZI|nr:hypothetical protein CERZMDRAFT_92925 [Cercospora zeae-maydis SCOH1-5]